MPSMHLLDLTLLLKTLQTPERLILEKMEKESHIESNPPNRHNNQQQDTTTAATDVLFQVCKPSARSLVLQAYITISKIEVLMTR